MRFPVWLALTAACSGSPSPDTDLPADPPEDTEPPVDTAPPIDTGLTADTDPPADTDPAPDADSDGTPDADDCDDVRADIHLAADELCDGVDNDCDGAVDDADSEVDCPVYSAAADYSVTANPHGVWSVGWASTATGTLHLFSIQAATSTVYSVGYWTDPAVVSSLTPSYWKNDLAASYGAPVGYVWLHPGCNAQEYAVLRFTAPHAATCTASISLPYGDSGETDATVLLNGTQLHYDDATSSPPSWEDSLTMSAGDTLDVAVGTLGSCSFDSTAVEFTVACRVATGL